MGRSVMALVAVFVLGLTGRGAMAQERAMHRVVFAVVSGDAADWGMTTTNIKNLIAGLQPESVDVEVVTYAGGLNMLKLGSPVATEIAALEGKHVRFVACENSMRAQKVEVKDLLAGSGTVPSGVVEIVRREEQGWAYIKGGR